MTVTTAIIAMIQGRGFRTNSSSSLMFFPLSLAGLVALFFFPGVGVVDDQVGQGELAGGLGGGDQAVDGLGLPGEGM